MESWQHALLDEGVDSVDGARAAGWQQALLEDEDTPPQSWQEALLDDVQAAQHGTEVLQQCTWEADILREGTDDDSDSFQVSSSQEDLSESWWWVPRLRDAVRSITGQRLRLCSPPRALRVVSCCTGGSAEAQVFKARPSRCHTFFRQHRTTLFPEHRSISPLCINEMN